MISGGFAQQPKNPKFGNALKRSTVRGSKKTGSKLLNKGIKSVQQMLSLAFGKYIWIFFVVITSLLLLFSIFHLASDEDNGQHGSYIDNKNHETTKDEDNDGLLDIEYSVANAACKGYYEILSDYTVLQEYEENGETILIPLNDRRAKKDALGRDTKMVMDPNILYAMNEYVFSYEYVYPEAFLKPVANDNFKLCSLIDDTGKVIVESDKRTKKGKAVGKERSVADYGISSLCSYTKQTTKTYLSGQYNRVLKINKKTGEEVYKNLEEPVPFESIIISEKTDDVLDRSVSLNQSVTYHYKEVTTFSAPCTAGEKSKNPSDNVEMIYSGIEEREVEEEQVKDCYVVSQTDNLDDKHYFYQYNDAKSFIQAHDGYDFEKDASGKLKKEKHKVPVKVKEEWEIYNCRDTSVSGIYIQGYASGEDEVEEYDNTYLYDYLAHFKSYTPAVSRTYETFRNLSSIASGSSLLSAANNGSETNTSGGGGPQEFIESIAEDCQKDAEESGFLPSFLIAQACLESGYGTSKLSQPPNNNYFGMKAGSQWISDGNPTVDMDTREQDANGNVYWTTATWCVFDSFSSSLRYHSRLLWNTRGPNGYRYRAAAGCNDFRETATIVREGGYATDVDYVDKIYSVYEQYNLSQYDTVVWSGEPPEYATDAETGGDSFASVNSQISGMNDKDRDLFFDFFHAVDNPYDGSKSVSNYTKTISVEEVDNILRLANTFSYRTTMDEERMHSSHDELLQMSLLLRFRSSGNSFESQYETGNDLVDVALKEVGTEEDPPGSNHTKYNTWAGMPGAEWCNIFVCWCANECGYLNTIIPQIYACNSTADWYKAKDLYHERESGYEPKIGDLILFNRNGTIGHIGIVSGVKEDNGQMVVQTIEGNSSSKVVEREYFMSDSKINGYAEVPYGMSE